MSARLAIGLSKVGACVSLLCPAVTGSESAVYRETFHFSSLHPLDSLQAAMEATTPAVVIPCDNRSVELLHELHAGEPTRRK